MLTRWILCFSVWSGVLALSMTGCAVIPDSSDDSSSSSYYLEYTQQKALAQKMLDQNYASDMAMLKTERLFNELDILAGEYQRKAILLKSQVAVLVLTSGEKPTLTYDQRSSLRSGVSDLSEIKERGLQKITDIEKQMSVTNHKILKDDVDTVITESQRTSWKAILDLEASSFKSLPGLRYFFNQIEEDVVSRVKLVMDDSTLPTPKISAPQAKSELGNVEGLVYAPNGMDPVARALIFAPHKGNEGLNAVAIQPNSAKALECGEPTEAYLAKTCSEPSGKFVLSGLPVGQVSVKVKKGSFELRSSFIIKANITIKASSVDTTLPSTNSERGTTAKIAVVQGSYDHLENVLDKLGLADLKNGVVVSGSQKYDVYNMNQAAVLFRDTKTLAKYNLVMINCGVNEAAFFGDEAAQAGLKSYVTNGGRLYVTDQAYDIVEQLFPEKINFSGDAYASTAGTKDAAQRGTGGLILDGKVKSLAMERWLTGSVKCGRPGNLVSCTGIDSSVRLEGFAGSWAMMDEVSSATTTWVQATVDGKTRPMTVTFNAGKGKVLYSSYHTFHGGEAGYLYPQERILQYLVFEVVD